MSVGGQGSSATVDSALTNLSVGIRRLMQGVANLNTWITGEGNGIAYLEQLGYSSAGDPQNPGGISDAQMALNYIGYLNTLSGVYYGTVQQGGTGGTAATMYNFNNALSPLWAGQ
jgi:hypothetical protein